MDLAYVKKLLKLLLESNADEIEIEEDGKKIRVAKHPTAVPPVFPAGIMVPQSGSSQAVPAGSISTLTSSSASAPAAAEPAPPHDLHEIRSPIVGTFYRAPAPDAAPFVQTGSSVEPGSILCIVEAMKLMNEIESDVTGTIVKILVDNGQPVEYNQPLFLVQKT
jgi:acetyl-CoA carboxylase biotin carboxyl carrier protein